MSRRLEPDRLIQQLHSASSLDSLYVLSGDETLLVNECTDAVRHAAAQAGYGERVSLTLDARGDWSSILGATQSVSLFGDRRLISVAIPSGRPGRAGGEVLQALASNVKSGGMPDAIVVITLPRLDRATRSSKWLQALASVATNVEVGMIDRSRLPRWIGDRLARQEQHVDNATLEWIADRVEGNLLAAFQEVQKLGLLYPKGKISTQDVEQAVLNVARYNVFGLRDAMLAGQARRTLAMLDGLKAEGEALPLVLWAVGDEVRALARLSAAQARGDLQSEMRRQRVFGNRESLVRQALDRVSPQVWPLAVQHAHDIDRLIKGLLPSGRMRDPWAELARLALRVSGTASSGRS